MGHFFNDLAQRAAAGISADDDGPLLVGAVNGNGPFFVFDLRHIGYMDQAFGCFNGNDCEIRFLIGFTAPEVYIDIRIIAAVFHVVWKDAAAAAADGR